MCACHAADAQLEMLRSAHRLSRRLRRWIARACRSALDCRDTLIRSSGPRVAAIGVEGLVIVATPEAVLVMRPEDAQRVREAAEWFDRENGK